MTRYTMRAKKKNCQTTKKWEVKLIIRRLKQVLLTCHYWVKELCPLLNLDGTANCGQLMTCRGDGSKNRVDRKVVWTTNKGIEEPSWNDTRIILISVATYHRRRPAPLMFGCALDSESQLRLTHLALTGLNGQLSFIFSAFLSQPPWKSGLLQF